MEVAQSMQIGKPISSCVGKPHECGFVPSVGNFPPKGTTSASCRCVQAVKGVNPFCGINHIAAAPQIVERIIDRDNARAIFVGKLHAAFHGVKSRRLAELAVRVPPFHRFVFTGNLLNRRARFASARLVTKSSSRCSALMALCVLIPCQALKPGKPAPRCRLLGGITAMLIRSGDEGIVERGGDNKIQRHCGRLQRIDVFLIAVCDPQD